MTGLLPKSEAKGVDFCGGDPAHHYIIRSDLGCYMYSTNIHQGLDLTVYDLHPSCQGGDHYLASCDKFYIIKGNTYRCVSDMTKDFDSAVYDLHPKCEEGDHYVYAFGRFYIIFQSRGVFRQTSDLATDKDGVECSLHPNCRDGLYYWGTKNCIYLIKPKNQWGVQFHKTGDLQEDTKANTYSVHPGVLNFLPGGLAVTHGPAFAKWDLIKTIANDSDTPITWEQKITRKVGYTKSKASSLEHNWKTSLSAKCKLESLILEVIKLQFLMMVEYGGQSIRTDSESWEEATDVEENVNLTLQPSTKVYVWQYKLSLGKEDVLFCRDIRFNNGPDPPTDAPLHNQCCDAWGCMDMFFKYFFGCQSKRKAS